MSSDSWETLTLDEVAHYQNGRATKPAEARDNGMLVVKIRELNSGVTEKSVRVDPNAVETKHKIRDGDLLFAWSASVGIYVWRGEEAALNQHIFRVQAKPGTDQLFLRYLLEYELRALLAAAEERQTTMGHVRKADLARLTCRRPPIEEQRAIAEVLGALDDRIEWCAGAVGRLEALLLELARGEAATVPVAELAAYVNGGAYTKHATGTGRLVIRIAELSSGVGPSSKYADIEAPPERTAYPGDILFSWSATLDAYRWTADEAVVNQHIFKVLPSEPWPAWFVYAKLKEAMPTFRKIAHDRATTMGHIKRGHLEQVSVGLPDEAHLGQVRDLGDALWDQHLRVSREQQHLANLRDMLLPRLLSGAVRIEDPARVLGAVA